MRISSPESSAGCGFMLGKGEADRMLGFKSDNIHLLIHVSF